MRRVLLASALLTSALTACGGLPPPSTPLVATSVEARPDPPAAPEIEPPRFPRVSARSRAGGTLWYVPDAAHSGVMIRVQTRRGEDGAHGRGLTQLTAGVLAEELEAILGPGRALGGANIHGAYLQVSSRGGDLDAAFAAITRVLDGPAPSAERVDRAREVAIHAIRQSHESPHSGAGASALAQLHGRPSDLEDGVRAWEEIYRYFGADAVDACRRERFAPTDRVLIVSGAFEVSEVRESFERHFASERPDPQRLPGRAREVTRPRNAALSRPMNTSQAYVLFARPAPEPTADDRLLFDMIVDLLGGTFDSRLNGSLRETHSYTYGAHAFVSAEEDSDVLFISSAFAPADVAGALHDLFRQLRNVRDRPFSRGEIVAARNRMWARTRAVIESSAFPAYLSQAWTMGSTPARFERELASLAEVTPEALHRVARRRFDPQEGIMVITGDFARVGGFIVERNANGFTLRR